MWIRWSNRFVLENMQNNISVVNFLSTLTKDRKLGIFACLCELKMFFIFFCSSVIDDARIKHSSSFLYIIHNIIYFLIFIRYTRRAHCCVYSHNTNAVGLCNLTAVKGLPPPSASTLPTHRSRKLFSSTLWGVWVGRRTAVWQHSRLSRTRAFARVCYYVIRGPVTSSLTSYFLHRLGKFSSSNSSRVNFHRLCIAVSFAPPIDAPRDVENMYYCNTQVVRRARFPADGTHDRVPHAIFRAKNIDSHSSCAIYRHQRHGKLV